MKNPLIELIFFSEKRKDLLLFLRDGPKTIEQIKISLEVSAVAILPQLKKLRESYLVFKDGDVYSLSPLGILVAGKMKAMVGVLNVFGNNYNYWENHAVECIPSHLLKRIEELANCTFSEPPDWTRLFEPHKEFVENLEKSKHVKGIASIFHPLYPSLFLSFAKKGMEVSILVTDSVYERVRNEFQAEFREFLEFENTSFYVCREKIELSHVVTDCFLSLTLPFSDGTYDHKEDVLCFDDVALRWGEDLFAYYMGRSEKITEI